MNHIFYLMGKSASGKDTIYESLLSDTTLHLSPLIPWTTRPVRAREKEGVEYHFVTEEKRRELEAAGKIIEGR
ncbi:MAG: guanylate kinase, partial [Lachnospiraceae bacterium]|nr:guanylate kinase [Lachnospiraceae bacterium]